MNRPGSVYFETKNPSASVIDKGESSKFHVWCLKAPLGVQGERNGTKCPIRRLIRINRMQSPVSGTCQAEN